MMRADAEERKSGLRAIAVYHRSSWVINLALQGSSEPLPPPPPPPPPRRCSERLPRIVLSRGIVQRARSYQINLEISRNFFRLETGRRKRERESEKRREEKRDGWGSPSSSSSSSTTNRRLLERRHRRDPVYGPYTSRAGRIAFLYCFISTKHSRGPPAPSASPPLPPPRPSVRVNPALVAPSLSSSLARLYPALALRMLPCSLAPCLSLSHFL